MSRYAPYGLAIIAAPSGALGCQKRSSHERAPAPEQAASAPAEAAQSK